MATKVFKPSEITDPVFPFEKENGTRADFDPWGFIAVVEQAGDGQLATADAIRAYIGYPTSAEIADTPAGQEKPKTLTLNCCQDLQTAVMEFITDLPSTQKKMRLSQKLSTSASNLQS